MDQCQIARQIFELQKMTFQNFFNAVSIFQDMTSQAARIALEQAPGINTEKAGSKFYIDLFKRGRESLETAIVNVFDKLADECPIREAALSQEAESIDQPALTDREREVLKLFGRRRTRKDISKALSISIKTVDKHRTSIMKKLKARNISDLTAYAKEEGLIHGSDQNMEALVEAYYL
jgi:DNA-binding CsgD family transcriptional regulator